MNENKRVKPTETEVPTADANQEANVRAAIVSARLCDRTSPKLSNPKLGQERFQAASFWELELRRGVDTRCHLGKSDLSVLLWGSHLKTPSPAKGRAVFFQYPFLYSRFILNS